MSVKIFSYNTWCVPFITWTSHVSKIASFIKQVVRKHNIDIICLSEIFKPWVREQILQELSDLEGNWKVSPIIYPASITVSSGLMVLWKLDTVVRNGKMHTILFDRCFQMDCFSNKGALHVPFQTSDGKEINLVHTHMQAWIPSNFCNTVRSSQFKQISKMLQAIPASNRIIVGDFNENPNVEFANENNLRIPNPFYETYEKNYFDHLYTSLGEEEVQVELAHIENNYGPSDHKGIVISLF